MAQTKTALKPSDGETEDLAQQLADLRADLTKITNTLAEMGSKRSEAAVESLRGSAQALRDQGEQSLKVAQARAQNVTQQAENAVRDQPAMAVGIAVGLGFLLGVITSRK
ncbi:DUF883 family protein [Sedimentitalea nanhaiensis]|uniref:Membrane-anchored ribosome-binding protein, inhibits growth in stationary phase, ElaB/YqjD/DUF883 family n=1 Tax=Sedimentitalea nanhaiensis TaxID=999627 RepID=A0A1I7BH06_9RHOB|nr:DUF883 family protein [Sedimentitalea nanhaiensis]SFT86401.1 Membrane-anchored ribosome-binding protein, inhibits growth in stationary phase, ElaB/YqjD/DUF883 family [Sedimentitalea nanhaiensis]